MVGSKGLVVVGVWGAGGVWLLGDLVVSGDSGEGEELLQDAGGGAGVAVVGEQGLATSTQPAAGDHVQADLALVGPDGVAMRCRPSPRNQRECEAQ